eukprot:m.374925 g.374925  ORF g.374925 m.374925 type:complete len:115 (+) comp56172_c0_seq3:797-1141(+)
MAPRPQDGCGKSETSGSPCCARLMRQTIRKQRRQQHPHPLLTLKRHKRILQDSWKASVYVELVDFTIPPSFLPNSSLSNVCRSIDQVAAAASAAEGYDDEEGSDDFDGGSDGDD